MPHNSFEPTKKALQERLDAIDVHPYEVSRNSITGAVTRLSPYISHGFVGMPYIFQTLKVKKGLLTQHKLYAELGWREFFQHVWSHLGDEIFKDIRPAIPHVKYTSEIPLDILEAKTGIAAIDQSIQELYQTGYVHNHARMWLASYMIHFRKIHWLIAANWFYGYLLDGDLASNHLSWQWVGATFSQKPYIFNAENIAKYAPKNWHCFGSALDQSYAELEKIARSQIVLEPTTAALFGETPPEVFSSPPLELLNQEKILQTNHVHVRSARTVSLIHPWDLSHRVDGSIRIGLIYLPFHDQFAWSFLRWQFVLSRMSDICDYIWIGSDQADLFNLLDASNKTLRITHTQNPHYVDLIEYLSNEFRSEISPVETFFTNPATLCSSFSKFWQQVSSKGSYPLP